MNIIIIGIFMIVMGNIPSKEPIITENVNLEKTNIPRYRLGSLYINELDDEIIEFLSNSKKFCPHFHLSLQSLCDKTLNNMNRKYSAQEALDVIEKLHKKFNLPYLGCDIIVGFPQETEEDFQETYQNLKKAKHVTTISPWHVNIISKINPKTSLIFNGFDENVFKPQTIKTEKFTITYTGRIYNLSIRNPLLFFEGIQELLTENLDLQKDLQKCSEVIKI